VACRRGKRLDGKKPSDTAERYGPRPVGERWLPQRDVVGASALFIKVIRSPRSLCPFSPDAKPLLHPLHLYQASLRNPPGNSADSLIGSNLETPECYLSTWPRDAQAALESVCAPGSEAEDIETYRLSHARSCRWH